MDSLPGFQVQHSEDGLSSAAAADDTEEVFSPLLSALAVCLFAFSAAANAAEFKPLEISKHAYTERDFLKAQRAWAERALVVPFKERTKEQPWAAASLDFVGRALDVWPGDRTSTELPALYRQGQALQADGCQDPLVGYLTAWARWLATDEYYGSREAFDKSMRAAEKLPGNAALARLCGADFYNADTVVKLGVGDLPKRLLAITAQAWKDGGYLPEEDFIFVRQLFSERNTQFFDEHHDQLWKTVESLELPSWAIETVHGRVEVERAWKQRGVKFAPEVTTEQWKGFEEHLDKARQHLMKAWKDRPDQPVAALGMIRLTMGSGSGVGDGDPRVWFDRTIQGQCDYYPAFAQLALALTPRWGGSLDELIAFAQACADSDRFDTEVPRQMLTVLNRAYEEVEDYWLLYRKAEIAQGLLKVLQGYVNEPSLKDIRKTSLANLAVYAHAAGDQAASAAALGEYGPGPLPRPALVKLSELGIDEPILRSDVGLLTSPLAADFERAEKFRTEKRLAEAKAVYETLLPRADGIAASRLRGLIGNITVEQSLAAGEWATIPADPALAGWIQRTGTWFPTADGMPAITEADGPVRIVYDARVGANFELRATLKITGEPKARWFQGIVFGDERLKHFKAKWDGAFVRFDKGRDVGTARCFFREFVTSLPGVDCPLLDVNEFTLRVAGDKLTWAVNGKTIHKNVKMEGLHEDDRVGFGSFKHTWGITTSLQKLEVRRVPSERD